MRSGHVVPDLHSNPGATSVWREGAGAGVSERPFPLHVITNLRLPRADRHQTAVMN